MIKLLTAIFAGVMFLTTASCQADTDELYSQKELSRVVGEFRASRYVEYKGSDDRYHYFQETGKFGIFGPSKKFKISKDIIPIQNSAVDRVITYDQNNGLFHIGRREPEEEVIKADFVEKYTREEENFLKAVSQLDQYSKSDTSEAKVQAVRRAMMASYFADHLNEASAYAKELIELVSNRRVANFLDRGSLYSDSVYAGNSVLGFVALKSGNLDQAKVHLIESAKVSGSPVLNSFGPNTALARALLSAGEKQVVLEYLTLCENFWKKDRLKTWKSMIENNKTPPFNQDLTY